MIIGLCGPAGCGKSTIADIIGGVRVSFAEPMRQMLHALYRYCGEPDAVGKLTTQAGKAAEALCLGGKTTRHALQTLGTEWGRKCIHEDVWVDIGISVAKQNKLSVFDDVRYNNEADAIRDAGGFIIHVMPGPWHRRIGGSHASEAGVDHHVGDYIILNEGTVDDLTMDIHKIMADIMGFNK